MPYKKWNFDTPVETNTTLYAVYDCSPDWGSITYTDGGSDKTYYFKDETDFNVLYSTSSSNTADLAFYDVIVPRNNVKKVVVGKNVTDIGDYFCVRLGSMTELELPKTVYTIGTYFLSYCTSFNQSLSFSDDLTSIGAYFLYYCSSFNSAITLPTTMSRIGADFLAYCSAFNQPLLLPHLTETATLPAVLYYCASFNSTLVLPDNLEAVGDHTLSNCTSFNQQLIIPDTATSIGVNVMYNCYAFNQPLSLPESISAIGNNFLGIETSYGSRASFNQPLTIPNSVHEIGSYFLYNQRKFDSQLILPKNMSRIGEQFLAYCEKFNQQITFPEGITRLERHFMSRCSAIAKDIVFPSTLIAIDDYCFDSAGLGSGAKIVFNDGLEEIGQYFAYTSSYNGPLIFPKTLKKIGNSFMSGCRSFNHPVVLHNTLESIGINFFSGCRTFNSEITFPNHDVFGGKLDGFLTMAYGYNRPFEIPLYINTLNNMFNSWRSMTYNVTIPATITSITGDFFYHGDYDGEGSQYGMKGAIAVDTDAIPQSANSLGCRLKTMGEYANGLKLAGANAQAWKTAFPDSGTTAPFRQLFVVDDDPRSSFIGSNKPLGEGVLSSKMYLDRGVWTIPAGHYGNESTSTNAVSFGSSQWSTEDYVNPEILPFVSGKRYTIRFLNPLGLNAMSSTGAYISFTAYIKAKSSTLATTFSNKNSNLWDGALQSSGTASAEGAFSFSMYCSNQKTGVDISEDIRFVIEFFND